MPTEYPFLSNTDYKQLVKQCLNSINRTTRNKLQDQIGGLAKLFQSGQTLEDKELEGIVKEIREGLKSWPEKRYYYETILNSYPGIAKKDGELRKKGY